MSLAVLTKKKYLIMNKVCILGIESHQQKKKGRVHTSSITVVILEDNNYKEKTFQLMKLKSKQLEVKVQVVSIGIPQIQRL
jgi:hypothetical protein